MEASLSLALLSHVYPPPGCEIFSNMEQHQYTEVVNLVKHSILSTDLAVYFKRKKNFFDAANRGDFKGIDDEEKSLLRYKR